MLSFCLNFYQFQPGVAYKSVAYKKVCIWMTKSSGTQHHKHKNCTWLLTSSCNRPLTFYFESDSWIIFDCRNSFNKKLENLWTSKKTSLTQYTASIWRIASGKTSYVYCYVVPFHLLQYANTELLWWRWHRHVHSTLKYLKWIILQ